MSVLKKILSIFRDENFDNQTTEKKVLEKIDEILLKGPIDNINNRDDFIKFLFKIYFNKRKYKPFISYIEILFRYYLFLLFLILILIPLLSGLNLYSEISIIKYKELWIFFVNIIYFSIPFYLIIKIYSYLRKLLRNEIQKNFLKLLSIELLKLITFLLLIQFTWFIGYFLSTILLIVYDSLVSF